MSAIISGRVYWTKFENLSYQDKNKKQVNIKEATAKIVMLAIADSADDFGENSWNSFETLATKSSLERRSVIRVTRALIDKEYLKVAGVTVYGTNNFSIGLSKLGNPPAKRAKNGRPKTGDPEAFTGDPETETSDPEAKTSDPKSPNPLKRRSKPSIKKEKKAATPQPPEIILYKEVAKHYPRQSQRELVIEAVQKINQRLGRPATVEDLQPFVIAWSKVSGNEWSLVWLVEWAVSGSVPGKGNTKVSTTPKPVELPADKLEELRKKAFNMFFPDQNEVTA